MYVFPCCQFCTGYFTVFLLLMSSHREKLIKWSNFSLSLIFTAWPSCLSVLGISNCVSIMKSRLSSGSMLYLMNYKRNTGGFLIATRLGSCQLILWAARGFKAIVLCRICHFEKLCHASALGLDFLWACRLPAIHPRNTGALDQFCRWDLRSLGSSSFSAEILQSVVAPNTEQGCQEHHLLTSGVLPY